MLIDLLAFYVAGLVVRQQTTLNWELIESPSYMPIHETTRLRSVGECVYCGATDGLSDEHIVPFGQRICVKITVATPTAIPPTSTPIPPVQPTLAPGPTIDYFTADPEYATLGTTITLNWSFSGEDIVSARLTRTNPDGTIDYLNDGQDVTNPGTLEDIVIIPGMFSYILVVGSEFGGTTVQTVVVSVIP